MNKRIKEVEDEFKKAKVDLFLAIFTAFIYVLGSFLVVYCYGWDLLAAITLMMWGNNYGSRKKK